MCKSLSSLTLSDDNFHMNAAKISKKRYYNSTNCDCKNFFESL